jgi:hypothetical protein
MHDYYENDFFIFIRTCNLALHCLDCETKSNPIFYNDELDWMHISNVFVPNFQ